MTASILVKESIVEEKSGLVDGRIEGHESNFTEVMYIQEEMKTAPFGDVWNEFLAREGVTGDYLNEVKKYESEVLSKR